MHRILYATVITMTLALFSCQRPVDEVVQPSPPEPEEPPAPIVDSTMLSKLVYLNPPNSGYADTLLILNFSHDEQKRVSKIIENNYDETGGLDYTITYSYFYNSSDTLPARMERTEQFFNGPDDNSRHILHLTYQGGLVSRDSTINYWRGSTSPGGTQTYLNTQRGDTLYAHRTDREYINGQLELVSEHSFPASIVRTGGNLVSFITPDGPEHKFNQHRFNTHPDPLRKAYVPFPFEYHFWEWGIPACSNLQTFAGSGSEVNSSDPWLWSTDEYSYEYRPDGYPVKQTVSNNFDDNYTVVYLYSKK
ncbi:MAG: hypothetical protein EOO09_02620 [Chitinophagaceae bacterium]|nr:MAG: hypothetical protein EOO09_02620 [Chitinophagaceae bacterium]